MRRPKKYIEQYREIGRKIAFYRTIRGLTQEALAEKIEVSVSHISKIEAPQANTSLSLDMLYLIAEGLDIDIAAFFNEDYLKPDIALLFQECPPERRQLLLDVVKVIAGHGEVP